MLALRRTLVTALIAATASVCALAAAAPSPAEGKKAPDFKLQDQKGDWHTLKQYKGKWVVLYFYPKDETPGCTTQACELRDNIFAFRNANAVILGVSADTVESHKKFYDNHSLPFDILADPDLKVIKEYGVLWSPKEGVNLASRQTFLIDPKGKIVKHWDKVDPNGHSAMVLNEIKAHSPAKAG